MQKIKKNRRYYKTIIRLLSLALVTSMLVTAFLGFKYYRALRVNQFSKNIILSENYFLEHNLKTETSQNKNEYNMIELSWFLKDYWGIELDQFPIFKEYATRHEMLTKEEFKSMMMELLEYIPVESELFNEVSYICMRSDEVLKEFEQLETKGYFELYEEKKIIPVEYISQLPKYPNGCEAVSASMLLQTAGFDISEEKFIDDYLPKEEVEIRWGCRYGPDPKKFYAGDPASQRGGWGCFAPVIHKALNMCLPTTHVAKNLTGYPLQELITGYINQDIPVAIWITQDYKGVNEVYQWQSHDKTKTYLYPANQHCVVLCGYDKEHYYFADPLSEEEIVKCKKSDAEICYNSMGKQAIVIEKY